MLTYQQRIAEHLATAGHIGQYDPRHIEAYMRLEHSTLDGLSPSQFAHEVAVSANCVEAGGIDAAERNARTLWL